MWFGLPETESSPSPIPIRRAWPQRSRSAASKRLRRLSARFAEIKPDLVAIGHAERRSTSRLRHRRRSRPARQGIYMEKPFCARSKRPTRLSPPAKAGMEARRGRNRNNPVLPTIEQLIGENKSAACSNRAPGQEEVRGGGLDLRVLGSHLLNLSRIFRRSNRRPARQACCKMEADHQGRVLKAPKGSAPRGERGARAATREQSGLPAFFDSIHDVGHQRGGLRPTNHRHQGIVDLRIDRDPFCGVLQRPQQPSNRRRKRAATWVPSAPAGIEAPNRSRT